MNPKANAVLLKAKTKALEVKVIRHGIDPSPKKLWTDVHKKDGSDDWARFKRECVLLKRKG